MADIVNDLDPRDVSRLNSGDPVRKDTHLGDVLVELQQAAEMDQLETLQNVGAAGVNLAGVTGSTLRLRKLLAGAGITLNELPGGELEVVGGGGGVVPGTMLAATFLVRPEGNTVYNHVSPIFDGVNNPARVEFVDAVIRCESSSVFMSDYGPTGYFTVNFNGLSALATSGPSVAWRRTNSMGSANTLRFDGMTGSSTGLIGSDKRVLEKNQQLTFGIAGGVNFYSGSWLQVEILLRAIAD